MTETGLFIGGGVILLIVFIGVLLYGMLWFQQWSENDSTARSGD